MVREIFIADVACGAAGGFIAGILAASFGWSFSDLFIPAVIAAGILMILARPVAFRTRLIFSLAVPVAIAAGFSYYLLFAAWHAVHSTAALPFGKSISFFAVVSDEPDASAKYVVATADFEKPLKGAVTIFAPLGSGFGYGDEVKANGVVEPPEFAGDSPAVFPMKVTVIARGKGFWLRQDLMNGKTAMLEKFNEVLPGDMAALLFGETLGGTSGMSAGLKDEMSASGTSYIISMYGYKIAMIIFFMEAALDGWLSRRARFFVLAIAVLLFVVMAGGNLSAIRAAIMALLALVAKTTGRISGPRNALVFTAAAMAFSDPALPAQASFELSFLSVAGMSYLSVPLRNFFGWTTAGNGLDVHRDSDIGGDLFGWREAVVVAVASLLPIIPIIAVAFGDFSLSAFPSNILIAPAILPALFFGVAIAALSYISAYAAFFTAKLAEVLLAYQLAIVKIFAAITVPLPFSFSLAFVFIIYYLVLIWFAYRYA